MLIRDMFSRNINREIKNVITVGKEEDDSFKQQELEEYVVTRELLRHFSSFYAAYKKGIDGTTPKMGVWISGFFGSGKSHFLKMLYYLLSSEKVNGKTALDYFKEDGKIHDAVLLADMEKAISVPTKAILFNIDAKNSANSKRDKQAIVKVFRKVFDDMQGYYGEIPELADLERNLDEQGRYEEFQANFAEKKGNPWKDCRHDLFFNQDMIVSVLSEMGVMSEEAARNWCKRATNPNTEGISIELFAKRVKDYIERQGRNQHVVFLVDEVGQYIGDDSGLMLNLQTVTEELGKAAGGKAWIIVTSQQDIDKVTNVKGEDFSKIQGRFDTRLSLSSANVDEVIKERILKKKQTAEDSLEAMYEDKETSLKNLISFTGTAAKKLYDSAQDFSSIYPFVGYQFDLLGDVLTAIRTHGASGKSLSEGERSMLSFFKDAAAMACNKDENTLIPFSAFYAPLDNFLDHSHRSVIIKAYDNTHLNPHKIRMEDTENPIVAIEVLKALFMVKYVKSIEANEENITSLMVNSVQAERSILREQVKKALNQLENEQLIQRQGNVYIFLTNEEQEINRRIDRMVVEDSEVTRALAEVIFEQIFDTKKYKYPAFNGRYIFGIDQMIDEQPYRTNNSNPLRMEIITAQSEYDGSDSTAMAALSMQHQSLVVALPNQDGFIREMRTALKIENFIMKDNEAKSLIQYDEIRARKGNEARERRNLAKLELEDALKEANLYCNAHSVEIGTKDIAKRINEALTHLVKQLFTKLNYITVAEDESSTRKMLQISDSHNIELIDRESGGEANQHAMEDMLTYIYGKTSPHGQISLKLLKDHFMKAPYGFVDDDVTYLIARLLKRGEVAFKYNGDYVGVAKSGIDAIMEFLTKKQYLEKLMIEKREKVSDKEKKTVRTLLREVFDTSQASSDEDVLRDTFMGCANRTMEQMVDIRAQLKAARQNHTFYPGEPVVTKGIRLFQELREADTAAEFFRKASHLEDDLLDFVEDYEDVQKFFTGGKMKQLFDEALATYKIYQDSQNYIADTNLEQIASDIHAILQLPSPYNKIKDLPDLREKFLEAYSAILEEKAAPVKTIIADKKKLVFDALVGKPYQNALLPEFQQKFAQLSEKVEHSNNINEIMSLSNQAKGLKEKFLNKIMAEDARLLAEAKKASAKQAKDHTEKVVYPNASDDAKELNTIVAEHIKKTRYIQFKPIVGVISIELSNESDIDNLLAKIKSKLLHELNGQDSIHIEF